MKNGSDQNWTENFYKFGPKQISSQIYPRVMKG